MEACNLSHLEKFYTAIMNAKYLTYYKIDDNSCISGDCQPGNGSV
jgi:hypothetical protein